MAAKDEVDKALKADAAKGSDKHIYVMRHGRTALDAMKRSDGWLDFPLTDEGRRGTMKAQQYLKDLPDAAQAHLRTDAQAHARDRPHHSIRHGP